MGRVKNKNTSKKKRRIGRIILSIVLVTFLTLAAVAIGVTVAVIKSSPEITSDILSNLKQSGKIYDMNGKYIEDYSDYQVRSVVSLKQIPENLQNAFIAIEDERFMQHHGVDLKRIIGAFWVDIKTRSSAQGASTITQQLIKNVWLSPEKLFTRKIQEAYMALQLERKLSKSQILDAYLNTIYLGGSSYGVEAAALDYFGKDVKDLTLSQCAFLAGLNKNPLKYYPYSKNNSDPDSAVNKNPENIVYIYPENKMPIDVKYMNLYKRRNVVLVKMHDLKIIDDNQFQTALNEKLRFTSKEGTSKMKYQWFIEPAIDQIAKDFSTKYGIDVSEAKQKLRVGGYNIYLTIDPKIQKAAEDVIDADSSYAGVRIPSNLKLYSTDKKSQDSNDDSLKYKQPQAAAVIFDYRTGQMRAIVGGRGKHPQLSINRATSVPRQPGSSIKPLAVYGPAIDSKVATAGTVIEDSPMPKDFVDSHHWDPHNYETKTFSGRVTIRDAIKKSINIVAIKLANMLNPDPIGGPIQNTFGTSISYLQNKFHLSTIVTKDIDPVTNQKNPGTNDMGLSPLALGALTEGVYPYEMAAAYGVFGNNGTYSTPIMYTKVTDKFGNVVLEKKSIQSQSISPDAAYIMVDMMKGVVTGGTGTRAKFGSMPAAGKTGTASDNTNLWFCGITPYYSGAVWIGHDKPTVPLKGLTSGTAAAMWGKIMKVANNKLPVIDFQKPTDLVTAEICIDSGKAPNDLCYKDPRGSRVRSEIFIDGTQPVEICDFHKEPGESLPSDTNGNEGNDTTSSSISTETND